MGGYDKAFYDAIRPGVQASAAVVVPLLLEHIDTSGLDRDLVDVGCGEGWWAHEFAEHGWDVTGIDGAYVQPHTVLGDRFVVADLSQRMRSRLFVTRQVALSLEVAEHLPASRADSFVSDLCQLGRVVVFSAAVPGQGGVGHVNEQWPIYWAEKFEANGYSVTGELRFQLWADERVENWYRQNLLVATMDTGLCPGLFDDPTLSYPYSLIHPVLHDHLRSRR